MAGPSYTVKALDESTWDAFAALVERNNGVFGGCWCIGFHPEGLAGTAEDHRIAKREHTDRGTVHQVLVYDGGHDMDAERPEAIVSLVADFLECHEQFVVSRTDTIIHP